MKKEILTGKCPHCGKLHNYDYTTNQVEMRNNKVVSVTFCGKCGKNFVEVFEITGIHKLLKKNNPQIDDDLPHGGRLISPR